MSSSIFICDEDDPVVLISYPSGGLAPHPDMIARAGLKEEGLPSLAIVLAIFIYEVVNLNFFLGVA